MTSITLPETFGYVILSCVAAPCVMTSFMGGVSESIERLCAVSACVNFLLLLLYPIMRPPYKSFASLASQCNAARYEGP